MKIVRDKDWTLVGFNTYNKFIGGPSFIFRSEHDHDCVMELKCAKYIIVDLNKVIFLNSMNKEGDPISGPYHDKSSVTNKIVSKLKELCSLM